jgi:hypothetical protein
MRTLIRQADISFVNGSRAITIANNSAFTAADIRLIVNETQKKILGSSMQKDLITSVVGNVITYTSSLPVLATNDVLTIEIDFGIPSSVAVVSEITDGKAEIATAINNRGGSASGSDSFSTLATKIGTALLPAVNITPLTNYPDSWHDLFVVMASVYDPTYPYMYAVLLDRSTPTAVMDMLVDGTIVVKGGEVDAGKITRWTVFKRSSQNFGFAYNSTFKPYVIGFATFNANIQNLIFNGSSPVFLHYNSSYTVADIVFSTYQFHATSINKLTIPGSTTMVLTANNIFYQSKFTYFSIDYGITVLTISGNNIFSYNASLTFFSLPESLTTISMTGLNEFTACSSLVFIKWPSLLTSLTIASNGCWQDCTALQSIAFPNSLATLALTGQYLFYRCTALTYVYLPNVSTSFSLTADNTIFNGCTALTTIELGTNWKWTVNLGSAAATYLNHDCIVNLIFAKLVDKRADGVNATTVTTSTSSPIVTGVNSQFTKVFVVGDTINVNGTGNKTILSIQSDTQLTLTTNAASTGSGLSYAINKTLTLGATNLARVSAGEIAVATNKGWTVA